MRSLVLDGGGTRAAFTAGAMIGFKELGIEPKHFDYIRGTSGGLIDACFYVTDQIPEGLRIWKQHLPKGFMKWRGVRPYNDLNYLEKILRDIEPLDCDALRHSNVPVVATLTSLATLNAEYICLNTAENIVDILLASAAFPLLSELVEIDGLAYYDGDLTAPIPIEEAIKEDGGEIWVIATTPHGYRARTWFWELLSRLPGLDPNLRKLFVKLPRLKNQILEKIERRDDLIIIRPEKELPLQRRCNNQATIIETINIGRNTALKILKERRLG
jgi:predicted patatin/cPLA2 family phospholipase